VVSEPTHFTAVLDWAGFRKELREKWPPPFEITVVMPDWTRATSERVSVSELPCLHIKFHRYLQEGDNVWRYIADHVWAVSSGR